MKLILADRNAFLCEAWGHAFAGVVDVRIHWGTFESILGSYDGLVSPANSFGLMDGGIDAAITACFGPQLQECVQGRIWQEYGGEQPVGTCLMVPTENTKCPWLAHCPTMTVPMDVSGTRNAYAAMLAALMGASRAGVETLACPGLGTATGRIAPDAAARQMRYAYDCWQQQPRPIDWAFAALRYQMRLSDPVTFTP